MSDTKDLDAIEDFKKNIEEETKFENLRHETAKKKTLIESQRVTVQLEKMNQDQADLELAKNANYGALSSVQIANIQREND